MVKTLRESKAKLSELVELASQGEEILISVRGKVKARLTGVPPPSSVDRKTWVNDLKQFQKKISRPGPVRARSEDILAQMREDRC